jgi:hypothetical protein
MAAHDPAGVYNVKGLPKSSPIKSCAGHGTILRGVSPRYADMTGSKAKDKGVRGDPESEGSS